MRQLREGVPVGQRADGAAAEAGVCAGDCVIKVNGVPVDDQPDMTGRSVMRLIEGGVCANSLSAYPHAMCGILLCVNSNERILFVNTGGSGRFSPWGVVGEGYNDECVCRHEQCNTCISDITHACEHIANTSEE